MEVEYMAVTEAIKEVIWLRRLLDDLMIENNFLKIYYDNMSAIYLAKNQVYHVRTKLLDVSFHFVREILDEHDIKLKKINTKDNPTDMLTKVISGIKFNHCKNLSHIY